MLSQYKAVCFDMDGTLMNTDVDYSAMADLVFDEMVKAGIPESAIDRSGGSKFNLDSGVKYLVEAGRANELHEIEKRIASRARDIELENSDLARPFPGALRLLTELRKKGFKTGVLTRGCREYAAKILTQNNVMELLDGLVCRDDFSEADAKPSPMAMQNLAKAVGCNVNEIVYIGDHGMDYKCAKTAGAGFIGVLSGAYAKEDWKKAGEAEIVNTIADLFEML
jgi:Predicted phosphatases